MSIWNKVLVGLILVTALFFFYLTGRSLRVHEYWRTLANQYEQKIKRVNEDNRRLLEGEPKTRGQTQTGIRQVRMELDRLLLDRRRAWFNCDPKVAVRREDGSAEVTATIENPLDNAASPGIADKTVLHAFEEAEVQKRGRYLGEFRVTKVDGKQVTFVPTAALSMRELDRLAVARRPWTLYEIMPRDGHEIFAGLGDAEKKAMLLPDEYLKDGQPAAKDDPPERVVDGKYVRPLRDYQVLFDADVENRALMAKQLEAATRDKKLVDDALAQARQQEEACQADIATTKGELAKITAERSLVVDLSKAIEKKLAEVQSGIADFLQKNQAMAGQIAKQQLEAARRIDQRTRAMAQSGTGER